MDWELLRRKLAFFCTVAASIVLGIVVGYCAAQSAWQIYTHAPIEAWVTFIGSIAVITLGSLFAGDFIRRIVGASWAAAGLVFLVTSLTTGALSSGFSSGIDPLSMSNNLLIVFLLCTVVSFFLFGPDTFRQRS